MIKASIGKTDGSGVALVLLGLSHENLRRLKEGKPILFNLSDLGLPPCDVFIFSDVDEKKMTEEIEKRFGKPK